MNRQPLLISHNDAAGISTPIKLRRTASTDSSSSSSSNSFLVERQRVVRAPGRKCLVVPSSVPHHQKAARATGKVTHKNSPSKCKRIASPKTTSTTKSKPSTTEVSSDTAPGKTKKVVRRVVVVRRVKKKDATDTKECDTQKTKSSVHAKKSHVDFKPKSVVKQHASSRNYSSTSNTKTLQRSKSLEEIQQQHGKKRTHAKKMDPHATKLRTNKTTSVPKSSSKSCLITKQEKATTKTKKVQFAMDMSRVVCHVELLNEWYNTDNESQLDAKAYWYTAQDLDDLKREAQDDAVYWEHKAVAVAWQAKTVPLVVASNNTSAASTKKTTSITTATVQEALRGLEGQTAEGHWKAYKARSDVVNAVLDEQDAQRRRGGWTRGPPLVTCADPDALRDASTAISEDSVQEAVQRGADDAKVARY